MTARSSGPLILVVRAPNGDVREVEMGVETLVIGRDESADVRVDDRKVSRRHAAFKIIDGEPWVEDLGSANGVRVNDRKIDERARIGPDDEIRIGSFKMVLKPRDLVEGDGSADEAAPDPSPEDEASSAGTVPVVPRVPSSPELAVDDVLPRLVGLDRPVQGREFVLQRGDNTIGRLEACDVPILDGSVSRQHARVLFGSKGLRVSDLGSSNGVFVNDLQVEAAELAESDVLRVGNIAFKVKLPTELAMEAPAPLLNRARVKRTGRDRRWLTMGVAGLVLAVVVFGGAFALQRRRSVDPPVMAVAPPPSPPETAGVAPASDAGLATVAESTPSGGEGNDAARGADAPPIPAPAATSESRPPPVATADPVPTPAATAEAERAPGPTAKPGLAVSRPGSEASATGTVDASRTRTATSPYTPRGPDGLPTDLPTVDPAFDLDGFVARTLEEAEACETSEDYICVRAQLDALLLRDPINPEAKARLLRVEKIEAAEAAMTAADRYVARGDTAQALRALAEAPTDGPRAAVVKARASTLKEEAIAQELTLAAREARRRRTWKRAHRRYKYVLNLDPQSMVALEGLRGLERRMRGRKMAFSAYSPPSKRPRRRVADDEALRRQFAGDQRLVTIAKTYARGALGEASKLARRIATRDKGSRAVSARAMAAAITEVRKRYQRAKTEVSNDPDQAWAMLIDLDRYERRILPRGTKSFVIRELEVSLSEAFADRGRALFDQGRFEDAFQRWESGYKLDATNPKILAGLKRLEEQAEKLAKDAELAGQRGDKDVCKRWKEITRMTRSESVAHQNARKRAVSTCR